MTALSRSKLLVAPLVVGTLTLFAGGLTASASTPFLTSSQTVSTIASTVPGNGDLNPYGVAVVPQGVGRLHRGWVLVSNFNAASNAQGSGTTVVQISPTGHVQLFATITARSLAVPCPGGVGLTTALSVLPSGWVIVGSLPSSDGTGATAHRGCLLVLDSQGQVRETITNSLINGPWDMTETESGDMVNLFVTNVLNGTVAANGAVVNRGTVVRLGLLDSMNAEVAPVVTSATVIGSGFAEHTDPAALVVGPTGLSMSSTGDTLYVADTASNRIVAIPNASTRTHTALTGEDVTANGSLNSPLGLATAPNGDILSVNAGDGLIVETTPAGAQVETATLDSSGSPAGSGALFGLALTPSGHGLYFVDDATNTLDLLH